MRLIGEFDLRQATREMLMSRATGHAHSRMFEELCIPDGTARIDLALVTDRLEGFELKSDFDTCKRLPRQIEAYNRVFDTMSIVTGRMLAHEVSAIVPAWWGIAWAHRDADENVTLRWMRHAQPNPARSAHSLAQLLWREEAREALALYATKPIPKRATRAQLLTRLGKHMDPDAMRSAVIACLLKRPATSTDGEDRITNPTKRIDLDPDWLYPELYRPVARVSCPRALPA